MFAVKGGAWAALLCGCWVATAGCGDEDGRDSGPPRVGAPTHHAAQPPPTGARGAPTLCPATLARLDLLVRGDLLDEAASRELDAFIVSARARAAGGSGMWSPLTSDALRALFGPALGARGERAWFETLELLELVLFEAARAPAPARGADSGSLAIFALAHLAETRTLMGQHDLAASAISSARAALEGFEDPTDRLRWVVDWAEANHLLGLERYEILADLVDRRMEEPHYRVPSLQRARYLGQAGTGLVDLARIRPETLERAVRYLEAAYAMAVDGPAAGSDQAREVAEGAARRAVDASIQIGDLTAARDWATRARSQSTGRVLRGVPEGDLRALELMLARAQGRGVAEAEAALREAVDAWLVSWRETPLRLGGYGHHAFFERRRMVSELVKLELARDPVRGPERSLDLIMRLHGLHSLARSLLGADGEATLQEALDALTGERRGIVVYFPGCDVTHLFLADRAGIVHVPLGAVDLLRERIRDGRIRSGADLLPPDAEARVRAWDAVTVVGSALLEEFDLSQITGQSGVPLAEDVDVTYLPSLAVGVALAERRRLRMAGARADQRHALVIACPQVPSGLPSALGRPEPIPMDARAAEVLVAPYPSVGVLFGPHATGERLRTALRQEPRPSILHVLCHGVIDPDRPVPATLLLAGADVDAAAFGFEEALALDAPPLVVLMACSTARGPLRRGDAGAADLGGAFLLAGADCVVLTTRPLGYRASQRVFLEFHRQVAAGATPARALREGLARLNDEERLSVGGLRVVGLGHDRP